MIAKMKKTVIAAARSQKDELLSSLRDLGVMHVSDMVSKSQSLDAMEKERAEYDRVLQTLKERGGKKAKGGKAVKGEEFSKLHASLVSLLAEEESLNGSLIALRGERERISPFGEFDPSGLSSLASEGIDIHIYVGNAKELEALKTDPELSFIPVRYSGKGAAIALVSGKIPEGSSFTEFRLPKKSLAQIDKEILEGESRLKEISSKVAEAAAYIPSYDAVLKRKDEAITFERVSETIDGDDIIYLTGYIPEDDMSAFKAYAKEHSLAYILSDPDDDDNPPTKIVYKGIVRIVKPVFDILGTVPGYREYDISSYFLVFFSLFFAMIIGDAGYGIIFILIGLYMQHKAKKCSDLNMLIYVVGAATVIWGAVTGTWFGSETILYKLPFLQKLVIPSIANYPEVFGLDATYTQNMLMKFCFILGAVQLSLGRIINIIRKAKEKDLSLLAEIGWLIDGILLYFLALNLVIGEPCSIPVIAGGVGLGFVLVCVFLAQGPGIPFGTGLKQGLAGFFTTFLDTISCFSNLMSYIRLFAVGMASLAIAQSFNNMGAGMHGPMFIIGIAVIVLGHVLNLVMGLLSVVVHGVRLNLLEFSGSLGMEWAGYNYDPFRKTVQDKSANNS